MDSQNAMGVRVSGRASSVPRKAPVLVTPVRVSGSSMRKSATTAVPTLKVARKNPRSGAK